MRASKCFSKKRALASAAWPAAILIVLAAALPNRLAAEDWPEIQGKGRRGVWTEAGILDKFPQTGLAVRWRTPIRAGYSGPAVADGRVFVADYQKSAAGPAIPARRDSAVTSEVERALCLDEQTGKVLWTYENSEVRYGNLPYGYGPRATPTVDGDRVYVLGAVGDLYCLDVKTGTLLWKVSYKEGFKARQPTWGFAAAPLAYGKTVICLVGGEPDAKLVALDRATGKEVWRSLPNQGSTGYACPIIRRVGGVDQLIQWHEGAVSSLDPQTGKVYWEQPFAKGNLLVATPVVEGNLLFVSAFYNGAMMLELSADKPAASLTWRGTSQSETVTDALHCLMSTPAIVGGHVYGVCSYGQLRCLDARTGQRIWETQAVTREKARWANAFMVRHAPAGAPAEPARNDAAARFFITNDRGELIIAEFSPTGYTEISRTNLIKPTTPGGGKRELGAVNWVQPAYANRHILIRNDQEIIRASLEK